MLAIFALTSLMEKEVKLYKNCLASLCFLWDSRPFAKDNQLIVWGADK